MKALDRLIVDCVQNRVIRQLDAADLEEARLKELAEHAGAMPGEYRIIWRFVPSKRGGAWPFLE